MLVWQTKKASEMNSENKLPFLKSLFTQQIGFTIQSQFQTKRSGNHNKQIN